MRDADTKGATAAGVLFATPEGRMLFMRRTDTGEWSIPAGNIEPDEDTAHAAQREAAEETGYPGDFYLSPIDRRVTHGVDFVTYIQPVERDFAPIMNAEHDAYGWGISEETPAPLHPGLARTLKALEVYGVEDV